MIVDIFIYFIYGILKGMFAFLPPMSVLPNDWESMWVWLSNGIGNWLYLAPAETTLASIPVLIVGFEVAWWSYTGFMALYRMLRG